MKLYSEKRRHFPDPSLPTLDGVVAMGDELSLEVLLEAYSFGIFPWPHPELPCLWFCPDERGVLDFSEMHVPRSLEKFLRKAPFQVTVNRAFERVMEACSSVPRPGQAGTWITPPLRKLYQRFHESGYAHSVEVWRGAELVGGIYGVYVGGVFSGESMFFRESNASKVALLTLIEKLKSNGLKWMDIQMVTPVTEVLGGKLIAKADFLKRLEKAKLEARELTW